MALFLLEFDTEARKRSELEPLFGEVAARAQSVGGEVIDVQVSADLTRVFIVVEGGSQAALGQAAAGASAPVSDVAEVRLVGATLDEVKAARGAAQFLVEWDFPPDLTMERYLERKKANAPNYAKVPEVRFLRTYVREDMAKCLCLYQAPDEECVRRARDAVSTPISRLMPLAEAERAQV